MVLGRDPIVLTGDPTGAPPPLLYSYDDASDGLLVALNGQTKGALPGGVPVDSGVHKLQLLSDDGRVVHSGKVRLHDGDRVEVFNRELLRHRTASTPLRTPPTHTHTTLARGRQVLSIPYRKT